MYPDNFVTYLVFLIGFLLLLAGINQFLSMFANRKVSPFSWLLMFMPLVLTASWILCIDLGRSVIVSAKAVIAPSGIIEIHRHSDKMIASSFFFIFILLSG